MVCAQLVEFASAMAKCSESISCIAMASYQLSLYGIALLQQINRWCLNTDSSALQLHILRLVSLLIPIALQAEYWPLSNLFHRTL